MPTKLPLPTPEMERMAKRELAKGFTGTMGIKLVRLGRGKVRLRLAHAEKVTQPHGLIHGGAIASLCDTAAGIGSQLVLPKGQTAVTGELKINFLGNVEKGAIEAEAQLLHYGKKTLVWQINAYRAGSSDLLAVVLTTFFVLPASK